MAEFLTRFPIAFLPVLLFLSALIYLDGYKLVRFRFVATLIIAGGAVAAVSYLVNGRLITATGAGVAPYTRYVSPVVEEILKALVAVYLIRTRRVVFLVDAAIAGFAVGAGFAVIENAYYLGSIPDAGLGVWLIRGFGTAIMQGGATAIFALLGQSLTERRSSTGFVSLVPGLLVAVFIHSAFNHFFFSPLWSTVGILVVLPPVLVAAFNRSEQSLREWLNVGFDADTELLELILSGELSRSPVGRYLQSLKERFRGEVVADMLCFLRLHLELSLRAKGLLMMRRYGFPAEPDEVTLAKFDELRYLEGSIGTTGRLAMLPFLHVSRKELWQLYMLAR